MIRALFDAGWEYTEGGTFFGLLLAPTQPVTLPHDASIGKPRRPDYPSGAGGAYAWNGVVTYRKRFHAPTEWQGQRVQLEFEGVMMHAEVSLNGHLLALHPYGYTSFVVDLTPHLQEGADNELTVVANNSAQPNSRWYTGTGIYRHVWLRTGGALHMPPWGIFVTTPEVDPAVSTVAIATEIVNTTGASSAAIVRSVITDADGTVVARGEIAVATEANTTVTARQRLPVRDARLWSVGTPELYTLSSELLVDGAVMDRATTPFGIRSIAVDPINGFRLNGVAMKLKGGNIHHDHGILGAASHDRAEERKVELLKSAGFNAVRCAHNPPAPALLDACDRLGMLVIDESFDMWRLGKTTNDYHLHFEQWWQRDTEAMVKRDRNHPAVIMWSIGNEIVECAGSSDGAIWSRRQAELVRSLDPTRPVTQGMRILFEEVFAQMAQSGGSFDDFFNAPVPDPATEAWGTRTEAFVAPLDVVGYNYLPHRYEYDRERFPERVICGTETFPHRAFAFWEATTRCPNVIGDFVWTALDYLGESGIAQVAIDVPLTSFQAPYPYHLANCGDFDICGFKRPQSVFRDILWGVRTAPAIAVLDPRHFGKTMRFSPWGWEPVIESWTFPGSEGTTTLVDVYSADDEVELLLNGTVVGRKPAGAAQQNKASFEVAYAPGTLEAVAHTGGQETGRTTLTTADAPVALRLTPDRAMIGAAVGDLSYVTVEVVDAQGAVVRHATHQVTLEVTGAGELIAIGTPDPRSEERYVGAQRAAYEGRLMAVVRSTGQAGAIQLQASAEGLAPGEIQLAAQVRIEQA
jgi:beta-galactosidase